MPVEEANLERAVLDHERRRKCSILYNSMSCQPLLVSLVELSWSLASSYSPLTPRTSGATPRK